jgi:ABC-type transport system substrate-binding protein
VKRPVLAVIVIIIVVAAGVGAYLATRTSPSAVVSSSTSVGSSSSSASSPAEFVIDDPYVPESFDPSVVISAVGEEVTSQYALPLMFCNPVPGCQSYLPVLATSWNVSSDDLTYTFNLRNNVYFSNGDPWNAYVVWWNLYRNLYVNQPTDGNLFEQTLNTTGVSVGDVNALNSPSNDPGSNSTLLSIMQNLHNSVTVLSPTEVQVHLTAPFQGFMQFLPVGLDWAQVDPYVVEQHGGVVANTINSWMALNAGTVGDGPYIVQTYVPSQYVILVANPNYWAQNITDNFMLHPARIPKVVINYKTDELTRALDVETGKAQASVISFNDIKNVLAANSSLYIPNFGPGGTMEWIMLDTEKPPLSNILVRRAVIAAINVTQIQSSVYEGYSGPVVGPDLHGFFGYNESMKPPQYNLTEARSLLNQAGYPNGVGLPPLVFMYPTSAYLTQVAEIVTTDLSQIGINVKAQQLSTATFLSIDESCCASNPSFPDIAVGSWSWTSDVSSYMFLIDAQLGAWLNLNDSAVHALVVKSNYEVDTTARAREISQLTELVQRDAADIWLGQDSDLPSTGDGVGPTIFSSSVTGDPGWWSNPNYWIFVGVPYNTVYYKGSGSSSVSSISSSYATNAYVFTNSVPLYSLSTPSSTLRKCLTGHSYIS